jgi:hypothetical protein
MKRITIAFTLSALAVCAQNFQPPSWGQPGTQQPQAPQGWQRTAPIVAQSGPVIGRPLSGTETRRTTQTLGDGTTVERADVSHFYRDGSSRTREESPVRVEIFDPVGHFEYDLNRTKKTYVKIPLSNNATFSVAVFGGTSSTSVYSSDGNSHAVVRSSPSGITEDLGQLMVNGVLAKGSRVTETIPVGALGNNREIKIVNERWYSDDLQILVKSINNDPRFGVNTYEITNIDRSTPDPSLFMPPSDFTEVDYNHR